jgi:hypothetical protein
MSVVKYHPALHRLFDLHKVQGRLSTVRSNIIHHKFTDF